MRRLPRLLIACPLTVSLLAPARPCSDYGSLPVASTWTPAPVALHCPGAPSWPQWHLYTPRHRALTPRQGYRPGVSTQQPALIVPYSCTGLLFAPIQLGRIRAMGFVVDTAQVPCR